MPLATATSRPAPRRSTAVLGRVSCCLYVLALVAYVFNYFASERYVMEYAPLVVPLKVVLSYVASTMGAVLLCSLVLDVAAHGLTKPRLIFIVVGSLVVMMIRRAMGGSFQALTFFWFVAAYPQGLSLETALRAVWVPGLVLGLCVVLLSALGLITNYASFYHDTLRLSFGFQNPNMASIKLSFFLLVWAFAHLPRWRPGYYPLMLGVALIINAFGDGQMAFFLVVLFLAGLFVLRESVVPEAPKRWLRRALTFLARWGFLVMTVAFVVAVLVASRLGTEALHAFSPSLTGRVQNWVDTYHEYGFVLWPRHLVLSRFYDNTYLYFVTFYGIIPDIAICALYLVFGRHVSSIEDTRTRDWVMLYLLVVLIHHTSESMGALIPTNLCILLMGHMLSRPQKAGAHGGAGDGAHR